LGEGGAEAVGGGGLVGVAGKPQQMREAGKGLAPAWGDPRPIQRIDQWEAGTSPPAPGALSVNVEEERALAAQFAALGYLDLPDSDAGRSTEAEHELRYNRITSLQQSGLGPEALTEARTLAAAAPGDRRIRLKLIQSLIIAGETAEARASLDKLTATAGPCGATLRMRRREP